MIKLQNLIIPTNKYRQKGGSLVGNASHLRSIGPEF